MPAQKINLFSSTVGYGNPDTNVVSEDTKTNPQSPYGMSKLMSEKIIQDTFKVHSIPFVILRYFNVAGADPNGRTGQINLPASHLIRVACQTASNKRKFMPVYGDDYNTPDGTCIRDYIHIMDLIDAHIKAIDYLNNSGSSSIFNCGYGHGFSVLEVIEAIKKVSGNDFQVKIEKRRLGDPESLISNNVKIKRELNWVPKFDDIIKIVSDAYKWELKLKNI